VFLVRGIVVTLCTSGFVDDLHSFQWAAVSLRCCVQPNGPCYTLIRYPTVGGVINIHSNKRNGY